MSFKLELDYPSFKTVLKGSPAYLDLIKLIDFIFANLPDIEDINEVKNEIQVVKDLYNDIAPKLITFWGTVKSYGLLPETDITATDDSKANINDIGCVESSKSLLVGNLRYDYTNFVPYQAQIVTTTNKKKLCEKIDKMKYLDEKQKNEIKKNIIEIKLREIKDKKFKKFYQERYQTRALPFMALIFVPLDSGRSRILNADDLLAAMASAITSSMNKITLLENKITLLENKQKNKKN